MADDVTLPFMIETVKGEKLSVTLDNHDCPFGAPRKQAAFELGGANEHNTVYLTGRTTPIIHTQQARYSPVLIKGHFRDHFTGDNGRAQALQQRLEEIRHRQEELQCTCGPWTWTVFPEEFKFPVEGPNDILYELRFKVLTAPGFEPELLHPTFETTPADVTAEARELMAQQAAKMAAQAVAEDVKIQIALTFAAVDSALDVVEQAATSFEAAPANAIPEARFMRSKSKEASDRCGDLVAYIGSLETDDVMTSATSDDIASFQAAQFAACAQANDTKARMRSLMLTANKRIWSTTTLYKVAPGDTLESIALRQLGSAARAGDIGYRKQDLIVGRLIRLPA